MDCGKDILQAKILLVDDDLFLVRLMEVFLKTEGFRQVRAVTDSRKAMAEFHAFRPDLVVLDLVMPHVDGMEILRQIQARRPGEHHVLILTAENDNKTRLRAMRAGARDFLAKPAGREETVSRVRALLQARVRLKQLEKRSLELEKIARNLQEGLAPSRRGAF